MISKPVPPSKLVSPSNPYSRTRFESFRAPRVVSKDVAQNVRNRKPKHEPKLKLLVRTLACTGFALLAGWFAARSFHVTSVATVSKDRGAVENPLPNLALVSSGAKILSSLTSPTYDPRAVGDSFFLLRIIGRPSSWLKDRIAGVELSKLHMSLPRDAFNDLPIIGRCWEFAGHRGHVAINLSELTSIRYASVQTPPANSLSVAHQRRMPKSMRMWGLVNQSVVAQMSDSRDLRSPFSFSLSGSLLPPTRPTDRFIRLASFHYFLQDIDGKRHVYHVESEIMHLISTVVFEILDNHGGDTTCIYSLGVHGTLAL